MVRVKAASFALALCVCVGCPRYAPLEQRGAGGQGGVGGAGGAGGEGAGSVCRTLCEHIYACGLDTDAEGKPLCPGFSGTPTDRENFVSGAFGCIDLCQVVSGPGVARATPCGDLIASLSQMSSEFSMVCDTGLSAASSSAMSTGSGANSGASATATSSSATASSSATGGM